MRPISAMAGIIYVHNKPRLPVEKRVVASVYPIKKIVLQIPVP